MQHRKFCRLLAAALLASLLAASSCWAVTVEGADGSKLSLGEIDDLIRHVTGKTSGDLTVEKESLLLVDEQGGNVRSRVLRFNADGTSTTEADEKSTCTGTALGNDNYRQGLPIAALPFETSVENATVMKALITPPYSGQSVGRYLSIDTNQKDSKADSITAAYSNGQSLVECLGLTSMPVEVKNGITVEGFDGELSAVLVRDGATATVYFVRMDVSSGSAAVKAVLKADGAKLSGAVTVTEDALPKIGGGEWIKAAPPAGIFYYYWSFSPSSSNTPYFPASIAVGDFNYDGYKNEIALAWSDIDHVYVKVLQLSYIGSQFSVGEMMKDTPIHDYTYVRYNRLLGQALDGVSSTYSVSVVAGDFNGDHKDEFTVVFRDNTPKNLGIYNAFLTPSPEVNAKMLLAQLSPAAKSLFEAFDKIEQAFKDIFEREKDVNNNSARLPFDGLTGRIHLYTHRWNGNAFEKSDHLEEFDQLESGPGGDGYYKYRIPVAVKAVKADVNGDGRDDVAAAVMCIGFKVSIDVKSLLIFSDCFCQVNLRSWTYGAGSIEAQPSSSKEKDIVINCSSGAVELNYSNTARDPFLDPTSFTSPTEAGEFLRLPILNALTGGSLYPFMDREVDIAAGKFTGVTGNVITVDDLAVRHPGFNWLNNKKESAVSLVYNARNADKQLVTTSRQIDSFPSHNLVGFVTADYLSESVKLGAPTKTWDKKDYDYTAILQAVPNHVDNLNEKGTALTDTPIGFTLHDETSVIYKNSSSTSETKNLAYNMTNSVETIFAFKDTIKIPMPAAAGTSLAAGSPSLSEDPGGADKGKSGGKDKSGGFKAVVSSIFGGASKAVEIFHKLMDSVETTTTKANENKTGYTMEIRTQSNYQDTLYMNDAVRYIWRYPVLTYPVPAWLAGEKKDSTIENYDESQITDRQTYITFAMSDATVPTNSVGMNDDNYHPYHEIGNLFSYPTRIEQTTGYDKDSSKIIPTVHTPVSNEGFRWNGGYLDLTLNFMSTNISQDKTKKVNKTGMITHFLSVADIFLGTDLAKVPQDSDSSFVRNVTDQESLEVNIPETDGKVRYVLRLLPYLDVAGTTTVAFAVESIERKDAIWGMNSLYSKKPDPSLLLPQKFSYKSGASVSKLKNTDFVGNTNDPTALDMKGQRFYLADYDDTPVKPSLLTGLKYKIKVPVYNASFVAAKDFKVRLSYVTNDDFVAAQKTSGGKEGNLEKVARTTIGEYEFTNLEGWSENGRHRQYAEFEWTPDVEVGTYFLFVDIDPEKTLDEIHENRRNAEGKIVDCGGNNMGYFEVSVGDPDSPFYDRTEDLKTVSVAEGLSVSVAAGDDPVDNGSDPDKLLEEKVLGADELVPFTLQVVTRKDHIIPGTEITGYKLKAESKEKTFEEVTAEDIELYFLRDEFDLFPNKTHETHFLMDPKYLKDGIDCIRFDVRIAGTSHAMHRVTDGEETPTSDKGSGGCDAGFGVLAVLALCGAAFFAGKRR